MSTVRTAEIKEVEGQTVGIIRRGREPVLMVVGPVEFVLSHLRARGLAKNLKAKTS